MKEGRSRWDVECVLSVNPPPPRETCRGGVGEHLGGAWWKAEVGCTSWGKMRIRGEAGGLRAESTEKGHSMLSSSSWGGGGEAGAPPLEFQEYTQVN